MQAKLWLRFNFIKFLPKSATHQWVTKFQAKGTILSFNREAETPKSGRKIFGRISANIEAVRTSVGRSPKKSIRRSQELGISHASLQKILNVNLRLYLYKIQVKHKLTPGDKVKRVIMCQWFQEKIVLKPDFLNNLWFSDETDFLLSRHLNFKNTLVWGTATPNEVLQSPLHLKKYTALVAMSKHGIVGPCWLEDENEEPLTVTKEWYIEVSQQYWTALGRENRVRGPNMFRRDQQ